LVFFVFIKILLYFIIDRIMTTKIKTHSGSKKRIKITWTWKMTHRKAGKNHLIIKKWKSTRKSKYWIIIPQQFTQKVSRQLPYWV